MYGSFLESRRRTVAEVTTKLCLALIRYLFILAITASFQISPYPLLEPLAEQVYGQDLLCGCSHLLPKHLFSRNRHTGGWTSSWFASPQSFRVEQSCEMEKYKKKIYRFLVLQTTLRNLDRVQRENNTLNERLEYAGNFVSI